VHGGLGLGLAIVRHLVELHRGTVTVSSEGKDRGSTFTVSLPIASIANAASATHGPPLYLEDDSSTASSGLLDGLRILVVDDEADARDLVSAILTRCGSEVKCSESVADAIQVLREWDPDLLLSDIGLPQEDGYSLIKKVRKLPSKRAKQIPALALTAYATDEDRSLALSAGFQAHLTKPIEPGVLITSIAKALGRGPSVK